MFKVHSTFIHDTTRICNENFINDRISIDLTDTSRIKHEPLSLGNEKTHDLLNFLLFSEYEPQTMIAWNKKLFITDDDNIRYDELYDLLDFEYPEKH